MAKKRRAHDEEAWTSVVAANVDADVSERVRDPAWQLSDLACYLVNLADDLQQWLAHGSIDPGVLPQVREELREICRGEAIGSAHSTMKKSHSDRRWSDAPLATDAGRFASMCSPTPGADDRILS